MWLSISRADECWAGRKIGFKRYRREEKERHQYAWPRKSHSDHEGYTEDCNLKELTLSNKAPVLSGTREMALALAQHRLEPTQTHEAKFSPWAPRVIIYAFYDNALLARVHQEFTPYKN